MRDHLDTKLSKSIITMYWNDCFVLIIHLKVPYIYIFIFTFFCISYEDYLVDNYYLANGIDTNIVTAQDVLIEMQIATQNSDSPDFW